MNNGRLVLRGRVELLSPAIIGCGRDDRTHVDLLLDEQQRPFIPATSFVGVMRQYIEKQVDGGEHTADMKRFWGITAREKTSDKDPERQSSLFCRDLFCCQGRKPDIRVRDGVKIDAKNGMAAPGAKYDYEVIDRGAQFDLYLEIRFSAETKEFSRKMLALMKLLLVQGRFRIGAKTGSGFGRIQCTDITVSEFNFTEKSKRDVLRWFKKEYQETSFDGVEIIPIKEQKTFCVDASFCLKDSLIVRSYSADPLAPDAVHIQSGKKPVLPGTSLKGAIRSRAERILKTLGKSEEILYKLFGRVDTEDDEIPDGSAGEKQKKEAQRGRVVVDEVVLPDYGAELQTRIKIDRFTGGTIKGALFETMPLFSDQDGNKPIKNVTITIRDYEPYEAGLMLLVLKDLWTGDLAVGGEKNIGRGVFEGIQAEITWGTKKVTLKKETDGLSSGDRAALEAFVSALSNL